jgi:hypothetical protein
VLAAHTADRRAGACAIAQSLKKAGRRDAARRRLAAGLARDATLQCAVQGLKTLAKEDAAAALAARKNAAAQATIEFRAKCARADTLAEAGAKDEAAALYTEVLEERNLPCASDGLAALETKSRPERLEAWLTQWTSISSPRWRCLRSRQRSPCSRGGAGREGGSPRSGPRRGSSGRS